MHKCKECVNYNEKIVYLGTLGTSFNECGKMLTGIPYEWGLCENKYTNAEGVTDQQFVSPNRITCKDFTWHKVN